MKRSALRRKITEYLKRTESLKKIINCDKDGIKNIRVPTISRQDSSPSTTYQGNREELIRLSGTTPQIIAAMEIATTGDMYAQEGNYAIAQEKYELALGKLLALMQNEPKGRRKELLREEIERWMSQAEVVKDLKEGGTSKEAGASTNNEGYDEKGCFLQ